MKAFKSEIVKLIKSVKDLSGQKIESLIERPSNRTRGDYALACFRLGKSLKRPPHEIAAEIASQLKPSGLISSIKAQGGYVNFFAEPVELTKLVIKQIISEKENYGSANVGKDKTVVIDYSSPNIAKPMGIGHLRSTVIGNALYKIYNALGYDCVGINYLGDWGTQFGHVIYSWRSSSSGRKDIEGIALSTTTASQLYTLSASSQNPDVQEKAREEFRKLEKGDSTNRAFWDNLRKRSIREWENIYQLLEVKFDEYSGESSTDKPDKNGVNVSKVIDELKGKDISEISEGALVVDLKKYSMQPCLLKKSDGATLYATRDITAAIQRHNKYKFDKLVYVVGSDQKLHFRQVFKVLELMGYGWAQNCVHVDFGLVRLKGEKMSTRKGTTILLEEVLKEAIGRSKSIMKERAPGIAQKISADNIDKIAKDVGIGAIIFNDLKNKRTRNIDFDWDQILSFDGETGPYLQYTHTRLASLLKKAEDEGFSIEKTKEVNPELLKADEEIAIIKLLNDFPEIIKRSAREHEPSVLSNYLLESASVFNRFYRFHRIVNPSDKELSRARIKLVRCLKYVLARGLDLLGIKPLEEM